MHEYIKRSDAINEVNRGDLLVGNNAEWAKEIIWRTPYSDVAPVQHAHWVIRHRYFNTTYTCSKCREGSTQKTNYCSNCGARMDGEPWYE